MGGGGGLGRVDSCVVVDSTRVRFLEESEETVFYAAVVYQIFFLYLKKHLEDNTLTPGNQGPCHAHTQHTVQRVIAPVTRCFVVTEK